MSTQTAVLTRRERKHARKAEQQAEDARLSAITGHIHFLREQRLIWAVVAGFLGAAFIAGLYFGILECNWHVFSLKEWWDNLFPEKWWPTYRHTAFRDIPEPAFAIMGVMMVTAGRKQWDKRVSTLRLVVSPFILITLTFALGILGTWILNYAFGHPILQWHSVGDFILGFAIGRILHVFWAPVGATLQGQVLDGGAERAAARHRVPSWVRLPFAAPQLRQRFAKLYLDVRNPDVDTIKPATGFRAWLIGGMVVVIALIIILGIVGHYWVGTGHTIPFIQPV